MPRKPRFLRILLGLVLIALIVLVLSSIPYGVLREERSRALYGESRSVGIILERSEAEKSIVYQYIDTDGRPRKGRSILGEDGWKLYGDADRIPIWFTHGQPWLVRAHGEEEPLFQTWLRRVVKRD